MLLDPLERRKNFVDVPCSRDNFDRPLEQPPLARRRITDDDHQSCDSAAAASGPSDSSSRASRFAHSTAVGLGGGGVRRPREHVRPVRVADGRGQVDAIAPSERHPVSAAARDSSPRCRSARECDRGPRRRTAEHRRRSACAPPASAISHHSASVSVSCVPVIATDNGGYSAGSPVSQRIPCSRARRAARSTRARTPGTVPRSSTLTSASVSIMMRITVSPSSICRGSFGRHEKRRPPIERPHVRAIEADQVIDAKPVVQIRPASARACEATRNRSCAPRPSCKAAAPTPGRSR